MGGCLKPNQLNNHHLVLDFKHHFLHKASLHEALSAPNTSLHEAPICMKHHLMPEASADLSQVELHLCSGLPVGCRHTRIAKTDSPNQSHRRAIHCTTSTIHHITRRNHEYTTSHRGPHQPVYTTALYSSQEHGTPSLHRQDSTQATQL